MTVVRSVPGSLAALLGELELDRPRVVTLDLLDQLRHRVGVSLPAAELARRLRRLGWLLPLRTRGVWEFAPADRAGPLSGGDPFIEVRAMRAARPQVRVGVGFESAAFLRSLASRQPAPEVIVCDEGAPAVKALDDYRRVDLTLPDQAYQDVDGLRVQTESGLLAGLAIRPDGFGDWPGLSEWIRSLARRGDNVLQLLSERPAAAWARAAYLLAAGGNRTAAATVLDHRPPGQGPFYLGPRRRGGRYDQTTDVIDTVVVRYAEAGQGA